MGHLNNKGRNLLSKQRDKGSGFWYWDHKRGYTTTRPQRERERERERERAQNKGIGVLFWSTEGSLLTGLQSVGKLSWCVKLFQDKG